MIAIQNMVSRLFPRKVELIDKIFQATLVLLYTLIAILALHIFRKSAKTGYVIVSMMGDIIFTGICIAILSIYSIAGVPADCGGLTRQNCKPLHQQQRKFRLTHPGNPDDAPNIPHKGFDTIRFGHGLYGSYGELDIYCDLPVTDFAMTIIIM
jgi:hypothetical protein